MNIRNAHCTDSQLTLYVRRDLPWRELLQVDRHLETCEDCAGWLARRADVRRARSVLRAVIGANPHLSYEQLESLAEGTLRLTGALASHVRECPTCDGELREMTDFVGTFGATPPPSAPTSFLDLVRSWFERPLQLAAVAAAVVAVSAGLLMGQAGLQRKAIGGVSNSAASRSIVVDSRYATSVADCSGTELALGSEEWYALYERGELEKLAQVLREPAAAGDRLAQSTLGMLIARGYGAGGERDAGRVWLRKAAAQGDSCARQALAAMK
jgi:anti-sigma factor RsiW